MIFPRLLKPRAVNFGRVLFRNGSGFGWNCCALPERALVRVQGDQAQPFLQGLITNDMEVLEEEERKSLYCAFLNTGGRILFDSIISKTQKENEFLLDVDARLANLVKKHLSLYKVRRKISITVSEEETVHAVFRDDIHELNHSACTHTSQLTTRSPEIGSTFCDGGETEKFVSLDTSCITYPDPRLSVLGHRIVLTAEESPLSVLPSSSQICDPRLFTDLRYSLGVAEGAEEIPTGKCFPLEYNLDYLRGVSFHKGCYIGQELTARTHHTGVIRKRILPLRMDQEVSPKSGEDDLSVTNEASRAVGKVKRLQGKFGLGLIRLKEAFTAQQLHLDTAKVTVYKPQWWPPEKCNNS